MAFTLAGKEQWVWFGGLEETLEGECWFSNVQSLLFEVMAQEAKQGDSNAHDAYYGLSENSANIESEVRRERCREAMGIWWRCTVQPAYKIWATTKDPRALQDFRRALLPWVLGNSCIT